MTTHYNPHLLRKKLTFGDILEGLILNLYLIRSGLFLLLFVLDMFFSAKVIHFCDLST